jgi:polar amino acid transport system substrate-binding protein
MHKILFLITSAMFIFFGCKKNNLEEINFGVSAQYPPFVFSKNGEMVGFDIDLAKAISKKMNKNPIFNDMEFNSFFPAINTNKIDVAISCITITDERKKNFDFSEPYYFETITALFDKEKNIKSKLDLKNKKIGVQLGTTIQIWASKNFPDNNIILLDTTTKLLKAMENKYIDVILISRSHSIDFSKKNKTLSWIEVDNSPQGCGLMFKKESKLKNIVDKILNDLQNSGKMQKIEKHWISQ